MKTMTRAVGLVMALCGAMSPVRAQDDGAKDEPKQAVCQSVTVRVQLSAADATDIAEEDGVDKHELANEAQIEAALKQSLEAYLKGKGVKVVAKGVGGLCELTLTVSVDSLAAVLDKVEKAKDAQGATVMHFAHLDQEAAEAVQGLDDSEPGQGIVFHLTLAGAHLEDYLYMDADTLESAQNDAATDCKKLMAGIGDTSQLVQAMLPRDKE